MAKVTLSSLSANKEFDEKIAANNSKKNATLDKKRNEIKNGWGDKYQKRVKDKNKLSSWQRIYYLADDQNLIRPILTFANYKKIFEGQKTSPSAGVICALVSIKKRWCMVIANDNTVASGSWWPGSPEKIIRAQKIALKLKLPTIYLVDCSGLFLPEQKKTFPGSQGAGHIFKMNSMLSDKGVPQLAGVMGDCIAGGGYMPIISDKVFMTEKAYMVIAGAALIKGAKSQHLSSLGIGGADIHVHVSGCADERAPDDKSCLDLIKNEIAKVTTSAVDYYRCSSGALPPALNSQDIEGVVPDIGKAYNIKEVIARLVDSSLFWPIMPHFGHEVITGIGKINGLYVGIVANVQELLPHPTDQNKKRPGGILYKEGVSKVSIFSRACNDDGIPIVWLQDVSGFDIGVEAERQGLLGYGSSLIYGNSTSKVPMITVLLRKASGAGYYAMNGLPYDPVMQLSTPISRLGVMEGKTLAIGAFRTKLDDNFNIASKDKEEAEQIKKAMKSVEEKIAADMDPYLSASQMDSDELIKLSEIRSYLQCMVECCYQSHGKRIKNPRIWSLHDLQVAFAGYHKDTLNKKSNQIIKSAVKNKKEDKTIYSNSIKAPMDGMFYLRPSPKEKNYVEPGQIINKGQTIGLIEVMKCFYPLYYEGDKAAKVVKICPPNASAVNNGDDIILLS